MNIENFERKFKIITLIGLKNMLTNTTMVIDESTFYYTFKRGDDNESRLYLSGVVGGIYECLPPEEQHKVLRDRLKEIILGVESLSRDNNNLMFKGKNESNSSVLNTYRIPEDYARMVIYVEKTLKR